MVTNFVNHIHPSQSLIVPRGNQHCYQQHEKPRTMQPVRQYIALVYDVNECRWLSSCSDLLPCNGQYSCFSSLSPWTVVNGQWLNFAKSLRALIFLWRTQDKHAAASKLSYSRFFPDRCKFIYIYIYIFFFTNPQIHLTSHLQVVLS